jgi:hypothetical protein
MGKKGPSPEQIIAKLRDAEVVLAKGKTVAEACRAIGVASRRFSGGAMSTAG